MSEFKVGCSPLTSEIFAGKVDKNDMYVGTKHDVTKTAVSAVAQHLIQLDESVTFSFKGERYILKVDKLKK